MIELLALEKFKATPDGEIKSVKSGKVLKTRLGTHGYLQINFRHNKKHYTLLVHRFIWVYFNGPIEPGLDVHHMDTITTNNKITNLLKATKKFNCNNRANHLKVFIEMQEKMKNLKTG